MSPSEPSSKAIGIAEILAEGSKHAFYLAAEHLPPTNGFFYVIWLYNSPTNAVAISKTTVGSDGRTQGGALLPSNAGEYRQILVTRETGEHATTPGPTVLRARSASPAVDPQPEAPGNNLPGFMIPAGFQLRFQCPESPRSPLIADLARQPRRVVAPDRVMVGDRAPTR